MSEHTWANNYVFKAARILRPTSIDELRRLVGRTPRLHAIGARHSFNGAADSPNDLIDLGGLDPNIHIDREQRTVIVGAGVTYGVLACFLQAQGWALHNMASLPHISIAGAVATGTHGSGDTNGSLSTAVVGLELVTADGDVTQTRKGHPHFDGIVVGLGAFGVVTRVTLSIQPKFEMRQDAFADVPWTTVLSNFDAIMSSAYSVSLMTMWSGATATRLWRKTRLALGAPHNPEPPPPGAVPTTDPFEIASDDVTPGLNPFGVPGPWCDRLPHFRADASPGPVDQIQSEYLVPRSQAVAALTRVRAIGDRIDPCLLLSEIRTVAGDALWLSQAYGHDSVAIHFTWRKMPDAVNALTEEIEEMLLPLGARPHWGKVIHARADRLAKLYPRLPEFRSLAEFYDPKGKFRNEFLDAHVF